jgi:MoaA/NifB/PqqE/SkfB family radical SAM enzyme
VYCYNRSPFEVKELTTEEYKVILDDLAEMGTFTICLTGGEPTLREDYLEIVKYASQKGLYINTATNGILIDENFAKKMKESGIRVVQVSLDGSTATINDKLRGRGSFELAIRAIKTLVKEDIPVAISFCATQLNIRDFPNVVSLGERLGVKWVRTMYFLPMGRGKRLEPSKEDQEWAAQWALEQRSSRSIGIEWGDPLEHIKLSPLLPTFNFSITADGWVLLSPYLPYVFGNLKEKRLIDVWGEGLNKVWILPQLKRVSEIINSEKDLLKVERVCPGPYIDLSASGGN